MADDETRTPDPVEASRLRARQALSDWLQKITGDRIEELRARGITVEVAVDGEVVDI